MKTLILSLLFVLGLSATTVSSITCSGQTATVNSTAHGLASSQGFSLSGTAPTFNGTVWIASTNSFTFMVPAGALCSNYTSGYTAVAPAKQIIQVGSSANPAAATVTLNYLMWFTTAYPNAFCTTAGTPIPPYTVCPVSKYPNASAAEQAAIVAGTTVETYGQLTVQASTSASTVQTDIIGQYAAMQAGFSNYLLALGYWYNGTSWVNQ
jgi:hypothetical protein